MIASCLLVVLLVGILAFSAWILTRSRNLNRWIWTYILDGLSRRKRDRIGPTHIYFALVDHFEPFHGERSKDAAMGFVRDWCERYPIVARKFVDADGNHPKHTIFYPEESYDERVMDMIALVHQKGYMDVEIHLHHANDSSESLRTKLTEFKNLLFSRHGLLRLDNNGKVIYGFIHGNWALDNSRRDGKMCGINNELTILKETGCFADFTLPSAPSETQTRKINSIYYATDNPLEPKSHDTGVDMKVGGGAKGDLLIVQGPLALNWKKKKYLLLPGIENGEITNVARVTHERIKLWLRFAPSIIGEADVCFVKVYTHGCDNDETREYLLSEGLETLYTTLCSQYNDGDRYLLHFVSAYEMFLVIKGLAEAS